jgi:hypothetical protein
MGALVKFIGSGIARAHQHAVAGVRAHGPARQNHGGRGPRGEESAELDALVAGKSEGEFAEGDEMPQQAVRILDSEIDRLDTVVKRFLDFTRPPEMHQEETSLKDYSRNCSRSSGRRWTRRTLR